METNGWVHLLLQTLDYVEATWPAVSSQVQKYIDKNDFKKNDGSTIDKLP